MTATLSTDTNIVSTATQISSVTALPNPPATAGGNGGSEKGKGKGEEKEKDESGWSWLYGRVSGRSSVVSRASSSGYMKKGFPGS